MKAVLIALAAAAAIPAAAALAQPAPQTAPGARVQTRADVVNRVQAMFARLDANRDGFLTKAEAQAGRAMRGNRMPGAMAQRGARQFDRIDLNRDGTISRAEWDSRVAQRQQRMASRQPGAKRGGMRGMAGGMGGRMFDIADVNRDSRLTMAEAQAALLQRFDRIDLNRDGQVTPDERRHMRAQRRSL